MKQHTVVRLLAAVVAAVGLGASAAEPDISGLGMWGRSPYTLKDPVRELHIATGKFLGYAKGHDTSQYAYFDAWGKFIYGTPQRRGAKLVAEEWVAMRVDCAKMTYTLFRYMEFDDQGNTLADVQGGAKPKKIIPGSGDRWDPNHMALADETAGLAAADSCSFDSD